MALASRVASVITVCTLAGAPAVLSACVTLCAPEMSRHGQVDGGGSAPAVRVSPAVAAAAAAVAVHDHHAMGHAAGSVATPVPPTSAQVHAACDDCCQAGAGTTMQAAVPARQDSQSVTATLSAEGTAAVVWLPRLQPRPPASAVAPPSPPRSSAVLRI